MSLRRHRRIPNGRIVLTQEMADQLNRRPDCPPTHDFRPYKERMVWEAREYDFEHPTGGFPVYIFYRAVWRDGEMMRLYTKGDYEPFYSRQFYKKGHAPCWMDGWLGKLFGLW